MHFQHVLSKEKEKEADNKKEEEVTVTALQKYDGYLIKEPENYIYQSRIIDSNIYKPQEEDFTLDSSLYFKEHKLKEDTSSLLDKNNNDYLFIDPLQFTMIGHWMWKYTRKAIGNGFSRNKHRRYFWIYPYTRTLYWSANKPTRTNHNPYNTKCVFIKSFTVAKGSDNKLNPPNIFIKTFSKDIQIQCIDLPTHSIWIRALKYFLNDSTSNTEQTDSENEFVISDKGNHQFNIRAE
ncbi:meiotic cell cortex C-terminal pleckstrin homology-domain-containing protein [Cokeromyces recurvatus]|uniref:meiotic cell cortex C-terminal pleckstrin homology-domain-containing protein n=1 Tax=Cokeromyces recurvatus TaxID=90255 RepID=UPI0022203E74|nr:meiotic cell cortex C-terminal pleckstrin homology-domain-containing protein [Cokeromyces recurvatus]KAI7906437.1 meiotic cell cortex C-terminal pleckstrin homology-domain-containing protein [Cokeromyces recurvatus]